MEDTCIQYSVLKYHNNINNQNLLTLLRCEMCVKQHNAVTCWFLSANNEELHKANSIAWWKIEFRHDYSDYLDIITCSLSAQIFFLFVSITSVCFKQQLVDRRWRLRKVAKFTWVFPEKLNDARWAAHRFFFAEYWTRIHQRVVDFFCPLVENNLVNAALKLEQQLGRLCRGEGEESVSSSDCNYLWRGRYGLINAFCSLCSVKPVCLLM